MANSILDSHQSATSNVILLSHDFPDGPMSNGILDSHGDPYVGGGGGGSTLTHGAAFTITGSGFGTKPASTPHFVWNGDGSTPSGWYEQQGNTPLGFLQNSGFRSVATPHSRLTRMAAAVRNQTTNTETPYNLFNSIRFPVATYPTATEAFASVYYRFDPLWGYDTTDDIPARDAQHKPLDLGYADWYSDPHTYQGIAAIRDANLCDEWRYGTPAPGVSAIGTGADAANPRKGWIRLEFVVRLARDSSGWMRTWEVTQITNPVGGAPLGSRMVLGADGSTAWETPPASGEAAIMLGGYVRDYGPDNYAYWTDFFVDLGSTRVVLSDANSLADGAAQYREPQSYTAWSDGSITIKVNAGAIPAGPAYLLVVTGKDTILHSQTVTIA